MPFSVQTPILGSSTGNHNAIHGWAVANGAKRPNELRNYLEAMYRLAPVYDLNADVLVAQSAHETATWSSFWWNDRLNPAGIGITGDPAQDAESRTFGSGEAAARAHVLHMGLYTSGDTVRAGFRQGDDPRWDAAIAAGFSRSATILKDLAGRWATDPDYATKIVRWLDRLESANLIGDSVAHHPHTSGRKRPIVLAIGMGHRNNQRGGAHGEIDWTPNAARALQRRARARNIAAELIAENDGDNDRNWSHLDRDVAAQRGCANIGRKHGHLDVAIFMHHNGGPGPGAHFIHPDGWSSGLRKADNPGDVRLCRRIVSHLKATGTVGFLTWQGWRDQPGVMSERESGAVSNRKPRRLGEMVSIDSWRATTFRIIAEAGSIDVAGDRAYISDPRWVEFTYCEAILDAIEEELGTFGSRSPEGNPVISPEPQEPGFDSSLRLPELDAHKGRPDEHMPAAVFTEGEGWLYFIGRDVTVSNPNGTPRHRLPIPSDAGRTGKDLEPGDTFYAWWGGLSDDGRPYAYTLWASRIWLDDTDLAVGLETASMER